MKSLSLLLLMIPFVIFIIIVISLSNNHGNSYQRDKILCKSESNRVIAGVCGGIAEYFGWSATIVRIFFIFSGVGLLTYVILAMAIPNSPSSLL